MTATTTIQRAERLIVDAQTRLLQFAEEIGRGDWKGRGSEGCMVLVGISKVIGEGAALLLASDGAEGPPIVTRGAAMTPKHQPLRFGEVGMRAGLGMTEVEFAFVRACGRIPAPCEYVNGEPRWDTESLTQVVRSHVRGQLCEALKALGRGTDAEGGARS